MPNPAFGPGRSIPLVERDPVAFWKVVSVLLALVALLLAFLLFEPS
jgi:hypothetical protein